MGQAVARLRTEDDLPISLTVGGSVALAIVLTLLPQVGVNLLGAILIVLFGFFFATVSSASPARSAPRPTRSPA